MPGFLNNDQSLANGIPDRTIGPETGSSGNATMTNHGGTSQGTNEAADTRPPPAAGMGDATTGDKTGGKKEERSFSRKDRDSDPGLFPETDEETAAQQIADGGDRTKHDNLNRD